jgi:hypothetical protein
MKSGLWITSAAAVLLGAFWAGDAGATVALERKDGVLAQVTLDSGTGKLSCARSEWNNSTVTTAKGKAVAIIDPFMYTTGVVAADGKTLGGYLNRPAVWDLWKIQAVELKERPQTDIVWMSAPPPGYGIQKDVTLCVEKDQNLAYVFNRLTALQDVNLVHDVQCMYFGNGATMKVVVDGQEIAPKPELQTPVNQWVLFYSADADVSVAIAFLPRAAQKYPGSDAQPLANALCHINDKTNARELSFGKGGGKMAANEARIQQYILLWGDGDLRDRAAEVSRKAMAGELNDKVYVPPAVGRK